MSKRDQYNAVSGTTDAQSGKTLPEGFHQLVTSAGNVLAFQGPAELNTYRINHPTQFKNNGEYDVRGK